jgi:membrane protein insertase Oxa1/YidC/SpoIIIJ
MLLGDSRHPGITWRLVAWIADLSRPENIMPLIFGVATYGQPSGLMLYWLTSNVLQLAQQWWLGKRYA